MSQRAGARRTFFTFGGHLKSNFTQRLQAAKSEKRTPDPQVPKPSPNLSRDFRAAWMSNTSAKNSLESRTCGKDASSPWLYFTWLYLKGVSTGDFAEALQSLVGERSAGLSANVVCRLEEQWCNEYEQRSKDDLSGKHYVYVWADGIHVKVRLEDDANEFRQPFALVERKEQRQRHM